MGRLGPNARGKIPLWGNVEREENGHNTDCPSIELFLLNGNGPYPAMVIAPGGGYARRADHEAYPVARWLNSIGISAIILHYRVAPFKHPIPLLDAKRAIRMVRFHASEWKIDPDHIGILGFSAGGHVAATAGTHFDLGIREDEDHLERVSSRPDVMVLCYPVITMGDHTHEGSRTNLLGESPSLEMIQQLSLELRITKDTPPAFLWHTADDASVDVENSLLFAAELSRHSIPFGLHIFESGRHGLGLAEEHPEAKAWPKLCEAWLRNRGF
ncbi:alpha/beta hydrolase [Neobacillus niacini]|uniref:alpha/beta hydrolase n=1 Tax=Neobacillus niacini TaxID=86668 RepID=UPI0039838117